MVIVVVAIFLTVPLFAGLLEGVLQRVRQGRPMAYGDAFNGFRIFGRVVWAAVLLGIIYAALVLVPIGVIVARRGDVDGARRRRRCPAPGGGDGSSPCT